MSTASLNNNEPNIPRLILLVIIVFIILFGLMFMTGCVTEKQRAKICATCPTHDSLVIKDTVVYKRYDSTIYISSAPEILLIENPCDSNKLKKFDIIKTKNGIKQEIKSDGKTIEFNCNVDSLKQVINGLNIERTISKEAFEERLRTTNVCLETWWQKLYRFGFWILLPIVLLYSGYKGIKFFGWIGKIMP